MDQRHHVLENPPQGWQRVALGGSAVPALLGWRELGQSQPELEMELLFSKLQQRGSGLLRGGGESFSSCWTPAPAVEATRRGMRADLGAGRCIPMDGSLSRGNLCVR